MTAEILRLAENKRPDLTFSLYLKPSHLPSYHRLITGNKMTFSQSIKTCLSKYATFYGTASRSEFWWFFLFTQLLIIVASFIDAVIYALGIYDPSPGFSEEDPGLTYLLVAFALAFPICAVGCRRLHDIGRSGWWQLLGTSIIGMIPLMIMWAINTKHENNRFKPKSRR